MNLFQKFSHEGLRWALRKLRRKLGIDVDNISPIDSILKVILEQEQAPIIVQLAAHIGNMEGDPLYPVLSREREGIAKEREFSPTVILVEPVRKHFEKLKEAYAGIPGVIFKNVAIADYDGIADFYSLGVNPEDYGYPRWLTELGPLKKSRTNELWDNYEGEKNTKKF